MPINQSVSQNIHCATDRQAGSPHLLHCVQHSAQGVLAAIGVPAAFGGGSLRLSVGRHSTADEVRRGAALIVAGIREQRRRVQCGSGTVVHSQQLH